MTDRLAKEKKYAVELEERTKELREILSETLSVKLKYEEIINQVIEGEKLGKTRPIGEIICSTPTPMSTALKAVKDLLPDMKPSSLIKKTPRKKQYKSCQMSKALINDSSMMKYSTKKSRSLSRGRH